MSAGLSWETPLQPQRQPPHLPRPWLPVQYRPAPPRLPRVSLPASLPDCLTAWPSTASLFAFVCDFSIFIAFACSAACKTRLHIVIISALAHTGTHAFTHIHKHCAASLPVLFKLFSSVQLSSAQPTSTAMSASASPSCYCHGIAGCHLWQM